MLTARPFQSLRCRSRGAARCRSSGTACQSFPRSARRAHRLVSLLGSPVRARLAPRPSCFPPRQPRSRASLPPRAAGPQRCGAPRSCAARRHQSAAAWLAFARRRPQRCATLTQRRHFPRMPRGRLAHTLRRRRRAPASQTTWLSCARRRAALICTSSARCAAARWPREMSRRVCSPTPAMLVRLADLAYLAVAVPAIRQLRPRAVCIEDDSALFFLRAAVWDSLEPQVRFARVRIDMLDAIPGGGRLSKLIAERMLSYQPGAALTKEALAADTKARSVCAR